MDDVDGRSAWKIRMACQRPGQGFKIQRLEPVHGQGRRARPWDQGPDLTGLEQNEVPLIPTLATPT